MSYCHGQLLVLQDLTIQLINKDNCQEGKDNKPLICIKTVARQLPRIIPSAIPRSIVIIILTAVSLTNGGLSESVELGSFIVDLNQPCQADFKIIFGHQDQPSRFWLDHDSFLTGENVETWQYYELVIGILIAAVRDCQTASHFCVHFSKFMTYFSYLIFLSSFFFSVWLDYKLPLPVKRALG